MRQPAVHWYEGLFVEAQHYQAARRAREACAAASEQFDHPFGYGVRELELDPLELKNGKLEIVRLKVRMRDGALIAFDRAERPEAPEELRRPFHSPEQAILALEPLFARSPKPLVYLALPQWQEGQSNVSLGGPGGACRYFERIKAVRNEDHGLDPRPVPYRVPNFRLMYLGQDMSGYDVLPLVQLEMVQGPEKPLPQVDPTYFPPLLAADAWPDLREGIGRETYDHLRMKLDMLCDSLFGEHGTEFLLSNKAASQQSFLLHHINLVLADLGPPLFASGVHPYPLYQEFCRALGRLSLFRKSRTLEERPPQYDHDRLADIFRYVKKELTEVLSIIRDPGYEQRFFEGVRFAAVKESELSAAAQSSDRRYAATMEGIGLRVALNPKWLKSDWDWYVGVSKYDLTVEEVDEVLRRIDWKIASADRVSSIYIVRGAGLQLEQVRDRVPPVLPQSRHWTYYRVAKRGVEWEHVEKTETLAMRFSEELLQNRETLVGQRRLVLRWERRPEPFPLQFALFAVGKAK